MEDSPYTSPRFESPDEAIEREKAVRIARRAWLVPVLVWAVIGVLMVTPGILNLHYLVFLPVLIAGVAILFFGLTRGVGSLQVARAVPEARIHAVMGIVVCSLPIGAIVFLLMFGTSG